MNLTYDEWLKTKDIHDKFAKHSFEQKPGPRGWDNFLVCQVCGMTHDTQDWRGEGTKEQWRFNSPEEMAVSPNAAHVMRYFLQKNANGESVKFDGMAAVVLNHPDREYIKSLRDLVAKSQPDIALAYARRFRDTGEDLYGMAQKNPDSYIGWLKEWPEKITDKTRAAICKFGPQPAMGYAEHIDKGVWHKRTMYAAKRGPHQALAYAKQYGSQMSKKWVSKLKAGALRNSGSATGWYKHFNEKPTRMERELLSESANIAFSMGKTIDVEHATDKAYKNKLYSSRRYAFLYNIEIVKKAERGFEAAGDVAPWQAAVYQLVYGKYSKQLSDRAKHRCNARFFDVLESIRIVHETKMTRARALKKSRYALAYMFLHRLYTDKGLADRADKNRTYHWLMVDAMSHIRNQGRLSIRDGELLSDRDL